MKTLEIYSEQVGRTVRRVILEEEDLERLDQAPFLEKLVDHRKTFERVYVLRLPTRNYFFKVRTLNFVSKYPMYPAFCWSGTFIGNYFERIFEEAPEEVKGQMAFYLDIFLKT